MGRGSADKAVAGLLYGASKARQLAPEPTLDERHTNDGGTIGGDDELKFRQNGEGNVHCDYGPAIERDDGKRFWYQHGLLHRSDGPAVEGGGEELEYWINGIQVEAPTGGAKPMLPKPIDRQVIVVDDSGEEQRYLLKFEIAPGPIEFRQARRMLKAHLRKDSMIAIMEMQDSNSGNYRYADRKTVPQYIDGSAAYRCHLWVGVPIEGT